MVDVGNPTITFGTSVFSATACIQVSSFTNGAEDLTYRCSGYTKHLAGDKSISLDFSLALAKTDTANITKFAPGATGIAEYHPFGDTATYIEHSTSKATIIKADESDSAGKVVTLDVTMVWDDLTSKAAT